MLFGLVFSNPLLLFGLLAVAIPIAIHFLSRRRYLEVPWGAMRFLRAASRQTRRRARFERLLLLAVRCLILALLAAALARPTVSGMPIAPGRTTPTHRVLIVDTSMSMGAGNEESAFDRAQAEAARILAQARTGDGTSLLRIGGPHPGIVVTPGVDIATLQAELDRLDVLDQTGRPLELQSALDEALAAGDGFGRHEIVFLSDFQRSNWELDAGSATALRSSSAELSGSRRVVLVHVSEDESANRFVADVRLEDPLVIAGRSTVIGVTVRTDRAAGTGSVPVELLVDGRTMAEKSTEIGAGLSGEVRFSHVFGLGDHAVEVRIPSDVLATDNQRRLAVSVRDSVKSLIVDGETAKPETQRTAWYLQIAVNPQPRDSSLSGVIRETVVPDGELIRTDLSRFDCLHLCNVQALTAREGGLLRQYVERGGGVVFWLGSQIEPGNYNSIFGGTDRPLLPAPLIEVVGSGTEVPEVFDFAMDALKHPIASPFAGNPGTGLEATKTFRFHRFGEEITNARTALAFTTGDPAIVEWSIGQGRVVIVTTSLEPEWSSWALWGHSLVPLVQEATLFAAGGHWEPADLSVGREIVHGIDPRQFDPPYSLTGPEGNSVPVDTAYIDGTPTVVSEAIPKAGIYRLRSSAGAIDPGKLFAVNAETEESLLEPIDPSFLTEGVFVGLDAEYTAAWTPWADAASLSTAGEFSWARWLLMALVAFLMVEPLLAWQRPVGLCAAGLLAAVALLRLGFPGSIGTAMIVLMLLAAAVSLTVVLRRQSWPST